MLDIVVTMSRCRSSMERRKTKCISVETVIVCDTICVCDFLVLFAVFELVEQGWVVGCGLLILVD